MFSNLWVSRLSVTVTKVDGTQTLEEGFVFLITDELCRQLTGHIERGRGWKTFSKFTSNHFSKTAINEENFLLVCAGYILRSFTVPSYFDIICQHLKSLLKLQKITKAILYFLIQFIIQQFMWQSWPHQRWGKNIWWCL